MPMDCPRSINCVCLSLPSRGLHSGTEKKTVFDTSRTRSRVMKPTDFRRAALLAATTMFMLASTATSHAADKVRFLIDWAFQGQAAPFVIAVDKGYFAAENLDVTIDRGYGSADAITKLASGTHDMAFGDINSMIEFNTK